MVANASLLYRMGIEGDDKVKAAISAVGAEEEKTAARAIAAAERKADRVTKLQQMLTAAVDASAEADRKALAIVTGNSAQYEAAKRRELVAEQTSNRERARTTVSVGQLRAGSQQLSYQLGDIAQQFAAGTPPMVIFAQQGGQVVQALQLMNTNAKGFLGFLGGPWGQAIMAGGVLLTALTSKMFDNADASKAAAAGNDGLRDAQSALGSMFDLTSGRLKTQNDLLRLNARLTAQKLRAEGMAEQASSRAVFSRSGQPTTIAGLTALLDRSGYGAGQFASEALRRNATEQRALLDAIRNAPNDAARSNAYDAAMKYAERGAAAFQGQPYNRDQFTQALIDSVSGPMKLATARKIEESLDKRVLDPSLRQPERERRERKPRERADNSIALERRFDRELTQLEAEHLALFARMTPSIDERSRIAVLRLDNDQKAYAEDLALRVKSKDLTQLQAGQLLTQRQANIALQKQQAAMEFQAERLAEAARVSEAMSEIEEDQLRRARESAVSAGQMREIELRLVALQYDRERAALQNIIEMGKLNKATAAEVEAAQRRLAALPDRQAADEERARRGTMGPMESYMDQLARDAKNLDEQFERIAVRGLQSLNDGLVEAIMHSKSLGDMFSNVADQIIADLLRIAIQQMITKPLMDALGSGGIPGFGSLSFASGTHHFGGGAALVGERGPEMALFPRGTRIVPANDTARMMGGAPVTLSIVTNIDATGAQPGAEAAIRQVLAERDARLPGDVLMIVADAQQRLRRPLGLAS